jgi:hypothetical protein
MDQQENWIDQQYVANEAASILEKLAEEPELGNRQIIQAALTMLREVVLNQYGLSKDNLLGTDYDDFVEFVVNEANEEDK